MRRIGCCLIIIATTASAARSQSAADDAIGGFANLPIQVVSVPSEPELPSAPKADAKPLADPTFANRLDSDHWRSQTFDPDQIRGYLIRMTAACGLFAGFVAVLFIYRGKLNRVQRGKLADPPVMEIVDQLALGSRCSVQLIRVNDQFVVLGRDASGLKAMVPLSPSFSSWWNRYEGPDAADIQAHDQTINQPSSG